MADADLIGRRPHKTTKALLVRNDKRADGFVENLFELLGDNGVNWDAAKAIGRLAKDEETLSKINYAVTKVSCLWNSI